MFINWKSREINLKIVYYGPALSGKTTNLQYIHRKMNPSMRGELVSLKTRGDRTLYFDFLQLELGQIASLKPRFNLYTVPGQVCYAKSRELVLQGADGLVFVADSQQQRLKDNLQMVRMMESNLGALGHSLRTMPIVLQCNKRDLPAVAPVALMRQQLGFNGAPCFESVATEGAGVFDTLKTVINLVVSHAQREL